jgi:hypothetical protein
VRLALTVRHVFDFGDDRELVGEDLVRPERWDALRTQTAGAFAIARDRAELERTLDARPELAARASAVARAVRAQGAASLASYGVGGGVLELGLLRAGLTPLTLTDYAPATVVRLRELLPEASAQVHDLRLDPPLPVDLHLFHRVDTELADEEWRAVFRRFAAEPVLLVAAEVADLRRVAAELLHRARLRRRATRAGWLRTRPTFEALWRETHRATPLRLHDLEGWLLDPVSSP